MKSKSWIDESQAVFLPPEIQHGMKAPQEFPIFWKGLFLTEAVNADGLQEFCAILKGPSFRDSINEIFCDTLNVPLTDASKAWVADTPLRRPLPTRSEFQQSSLQTLAKASLPGSPTSLLRALRIDPMGSQFDLWQIRKNQNVFRWSQTENGGLANLKRSVAFAPVSFRFPSVEALRTKDLLSRAYQACPTDACRSVVLSGPHASTTANQSRVMADLSTVSWVGVALLITLALGLGLRNGLRLLLLALPLVVTTALSVLVTVFVFGSIHGLTLAFGTGLVGLAFDYGIHASLGRSSRSAWTSGLFGLATTLSGLAVLAFSGVPLLRQMMFFAITGLVLAFALYKIVLRPERSFLFLEPFRSRLSGGRLKGFVSLFFLFCSLVLWTKVPIDLKLQNFEYKTSRLRNLENEFWSDQKQPAPVFLLSDQKNSEDEFQQIAQWSKNNAIAVDTPALYIPQSEVQKANRATWLPAACSRSLAFPSSLAAQFFSPFSELLSCANLPQAVSYQEKTPAYLAHLVSVNDPRTRVSVWLTGDSEQEQKILKAFPTAVSFRKLFSNFPKILARELMWMFPTALGICLLILMIHYRRRLRPACLAMLPLFTAVGAIFLTLFCLGRGLSFVSLVALIMIFGSSIDYGIFQVDALLNKNRDIFPEATRSSLTLAALATVGGYLPLAVAKHPVLNNLGLALVSGTIGAFLGGLWGVPFVAAFLRLRTPE